jgi:HSP20 family molecular chaperone IbpA
MYPLTTLLNALDTAFEGSMSTNTRPAVGAERLPRADILEGEKDFRIVMDMPGVRNSDLEISLEDDTLSVKAERNSVIPEAYLARRRELLDKVVLRRSFSLGTAVDSQHIEANLQDGVLTLSLPKNEKSLPRRIEVK